MNGKDLYRLINDIDPKKIKEADDAVVFYTDSKTAHTRKRRRKKMKEIYGGICIAASVIVLVAGAALQGTLKPDFGSGPADRTKNNNHGYTQTADEDETGGDSVSAEELKAYYDEIVQEANSRIMEEIATAPKEGIGEPKQISTENLIVYAKEDSLGEILDSVDSKDVIGLVQPYTGAELLGEAGIYYIIRSGNIAGFVKADGWVDGEEALELADQHHISVISRADRTYDIYNYLQGSAARTPFETVTGKSFFQVKEAKPRHYTIVWQDIGTACLAKDDVACGEILREAMPWPASVPEDKERQAFLSILLLKLQQLYANDETTYKLGFLGDLYRYWPETNFLINDVNQAAEEAPESFSVSNAEPGDILIYPAQKNPANLGNRSQYPFGVYLGDDIILDFDPVSGKMITAFYTELGTPVTKLDLFTKNN